MLAKLKHIFGKKLWNNQTERNHDYYIQVQGQLFFFSSNLALKGIIFTVYFGEEMPLFKEQIGLESSAWHHLPKLDSLQEGFFPEMLKKRVERGKILYFYGGWVPYGQYSCNILDSSKNSTGLHNYLSPVQTENVWRLNTIKHCLVTKHVDAESSGQTVSNMFDQQNYPRELGRERRCVVFQNRFSKQINATDLYIVNSVKIVVMNCWSHRQL